MAKRLNVDLSFTADTKQAEKNVAEYYWFSKYYN